MSNNFLLVKRKDGVWLNWPGLVGMGRYNVRQGDDAVRVERFSGRGELQWSSLILKDGIYGVDISGVDTIIGFDRVLVTPSKNGWCEINFSETDDPNPFEDCRAPNRWIPGYGAKLATGPLRIDKYYEFYRDRIHVTKRLYGIIMADFLRYQELYVRWNEKQSRVLILSPESWQTINLRPIMFKLDELDQETSSVEVKE